MRRWEKLRLGFVSTVLSLSGFSVGVTAGAVIGYFLFIRFQSSDVKDPEIRPFVEQDSASLELLLPEIPLWVKNPDYDRVDWLNRFLEIMWPYLDKAICRKAEENVKPIIVESTMKYKVKFVKFETFTLGSLPPIFQGVKVHHMEDNDLVMEPSFKWAGNTNITLVVKAYGLKAMIQVIDLQIFVTPRITLKTLVPRFPCFASIVLSLMEKPHIDFGLKLMGGDLMAIPGLYSSVQETIKNQVASLYLWPKTLQVPIMDLSTAFRKPVGILHVKVLRAIELRNKEVLGKSDPYVKLKLSEDKLLSKKTTVKHSDLNPEWNEEFKYAIRDPKTQYVEINIYDWEKVGKHEKMGMNIIRLNELRTGEPKVLTLNLLKSLDPEDAENEKPRGKIVVEVLYKTFKEEDLLEDIKTDVNEVEKGSDNIPSGGGLLLVIVHEAEDLEGKNHMNPYARLTFRGEKRKTKHIKKCSNPRWNEEFHFMCEDVPAEDKIHVEVLSKAPTIGIYSKETLGYVTVSVADVVSNKRINKKYHLIDSKNGKIQIEMQWRTS